MGNYPHGQGAPPQPAANQGHAVAIGKAIGDIQVYEVPMKVRDSPEEQGLTCCEWVLFLLPNLLLCLLILPICAGAYTIGPFQTYVFTVYGKVVKTERDMGC